MATYFLRSKHISRSKGARVTQAAAYRAGERIRDERTSEVHDHSDRTDVAYKEVTLPADLDGRDDMAWTQDRSTLWNAAEHAGRRRNSRLAREWLVLLPSELTSQQHIQLVRTFARELADKYRSTEDDEEFDIVSSQAYVAAATMLCQQCRTSIEVICIHCASGTASGEPLTLFTVSDVWSMDEDLTLQLRPWPNYRPMKGLAGEAGDFANHCPRCGTPQEDLYLHSEPDQPFFDVSHAVPGSIKLTPLTGTIQLNGNEHFTVG